MVLDYKTPTIRYSNVFTINTVLIDYCLLTNSSQRATPFVIFVHSHIRKIDYDPFKLKSFALSLTVEQQL